MNKRNIFTSLAALALSLACVAQSNQPTGGKTNWLGTCSKVADCAELEDAVCAQQVCTRACTSDKACSALGAGLQCEVTLASEARICLPKQDAGAPSQSEPTQRDSGAEFDETDVLFSGTISLDCVDDGDNRIAGDFPLQVLLSRDQDSLTGEVWGLPSGVGQAVSGSVTPASTQFDQWSINWSSAEVTALQLSAIELDAQHLSAQVQGDLQGVVEGDILTSCLAGGELALARDNVPPTVSITPSVEIVGFAPIVLDFNEPIGGAAAVRLSNNDETIEVATTPDAGVAGFRSQLTITPSSAWPSGKLTLEIEHMADKGQNSADAMFTLDIPERRSVTANASFEEPLGTDDLWFGCTNASKITYTDWAQSFDSSIDILPTDGATLAHCQGNGLLLQGYVEPPQGTTRLLIDVGNVDYSLGTGVEGVELSFTCDTQRRPLLAVDEATDQTLPKFWTYAVELELDASDCWLRLEYHGGSYEEGSPSGAAFVDNLRFE